MNEQLTRIKETALLLSGKTSDDKTDKIVNLVVQKALNYCNRSDIPTVMELALSEMVANYLKNSTNQIVQSVKEGDTTITYALSTVKDDLSAFKKLGAIKYVE